MEKLLADLEKHNADIRAITGINSTSQVEHIPTEEEQLQEFIKNYIDEPAPKFSWKNALQKHMAYSALYGGRSSGKSFGYHNLIIMDEISMIKERITLKPTKKQAKLLKKFRKLKRFK